MTDPAAAGYPRGRGVVVVVNSSAGPAIGRSPAELLRARLPEAAVIELADGDDVTEALTRAAAGAAVLGVAGGDGMPRAAATPAAVLTVPSPSRRAPEARDGETFAGPAEFTISKRPEPLAVIGPAPPPRPTPS